MVLAFLHPQTFSKTPPTCVRSGPEILESPGPQRITQDQPGPVLHDPCLSSSSDFFKNTSYLCPVRSWDSRATRTTKDHPGPTRTSPTWSLPFFILRPFQKHLLPVSGPILEFYSHQDHKGPQRTNQDQSYMILAFLNPHTISKTPPTCVRSSPGILEPSGPWRITKDKQGPVLHDPFQNHFANSRWSCNSLLFLTIMKTWYALDMHFKHIIEEVS